MDPGMTMGMLVGSQDEPCDAPEYSDEQLQDSSHRKVYEKVRICVDPP